MVDNLYGADCMLEQLTSPLTDIRVKNLLIRSLFGGQGLAKQHIDSFDEFVNFRMGQIIGAKLNRRVQCEAVPGFWLQFTGIRVSKPTHQRSYDKFRRYCQLYPHEARTSNLSYAGDIFVDIQYHMDGQLQHRANVKIGRLPIMLGSSRCHLSHKSEKELAYLKECPYDPRGYFIVGGTEKVLLIQEQMIENRILVERNSKGEVTAGVISYTLDTKTMCEMIIKNGKLYVRSGSFAEPIPVFIMLKALGMDNDQEVFQAARSGEFPQELQLNLDQYLVLSLEQSFTRGVRSEVEAIRYLAGKLWNRLENKKDRNPQKQVRDKLCCIFLAHIRVTEENKLAKAHYLVLMLRKLVKGHHDPLSLDNRDYYGNKRMKSAGTLLELLFEDRFKVFCAQLKEQLTKLLLRDKSKHRFEITHVLERRCDVITSGMQQAIATGNWVIKRFHIDRKGVSQQLSRISYIAALGMITRLNSQFQKTRKIAGPRALLGSHWGMICPCDTPDGEGCGLIKNLALTACLSTSCRRFHPDNLGILQGQISHGRGHRVLLDGTVLGYTYSHALVNRLRLLRRKGLIQRFVNVAMLKRKGELFGEIIINTDSGRLVRPLLILAEGKILLTTQMVAQLKAKKISFQDLLGMGVIEFLDVNEEDNALIANLGGQITSKHTHLEIDPYTIIGVVAGIIPYPHHNQSPRNLFQCSMGKQSQGISGYNALIRDDTVSYVLAYPQRPMVSTAHIELTNYDKLPAGQNASVAVMSYSGYDIEDAIVVNAASLDRGFQRSLYYRKHEAQFKSYENTGLKDFLVGRSQELAADATRVPSAFYLKRYECLDEDGLGKIGHSILDGNIYVNKKVPLTTADVRSVVDEPSVFKSHSSNNFIDRVIVTANEQRPMIVKTITREMRRPELGDKLSSRHGQKGVCGLIVAEEDMPFSQTGWRPDLIMNPHGYPSRMTVGKLLELIGGKAGCCQGRIKDGTAFAGDPFQMLRSTLLKHGFSEDGKDVLISGTSGEYLQCYVFSGPIFYQRLKHMVADKIHARSLGKVTVLTRQPTEGRSRQGGLRLGEMERDCLLGYGASDLLLERLLYSSDDATVLVCAKCGFFKYSGVCEQCRTKKVYSLKMPYACKLLFQELISMGIRPKINLARISSNPFAEHQKVYA